jgi:hypothetical protein
MSTELDEVIDQITTLLTLHQNIEAECGGSIPADRLDAETAARIAVALADYLSLLLPRNLSIAKLRAQVIRMSAECRRFAGVRELEVMNAVAWLKERFRDQRAWFSEELFDAARDARISACALLARDVRRLPIKRKRMVRPDGCEDWLWVAAASWPEGHRRPRTRQVRAKG